MKKFLCFILFLLFIIPASVRAQEVIDKFNVNLKINSDSSVEVTEEIVYNFTFSQEARHGIYRNIPYRYQARGGTFKLRMSDFKVKDDEGNDCKFQLSTAGNYYNLKIGDADVLVTGIKTYIISYKVKRALNYFADHDELYWNATGNEWLVPVRHSQAKVFLPGLINKDQTKSACFAGVSGSTAVCGASSVLYDKEGKITGYFFAQDNLTEKQGLTIVASLPKGYVKQPSAWEIALDTAKDNGIVVLPFLIFGVLYYLWYTTGRDLGGRGIIVPEYAPPKDLPPALGQVVLNERLKGSGLVAEIIDLAIKGYLKITRVEKKIFLGTVTDYELTKLKDGESLPLLYQRQLMSSIFGAFDIMPLKNLRQKFYKDYNNISREIYKYLTHEQYFIKNPNIVKTAYVSTGLLSMMLILILSGGGTLSIVSCIVSFVIILIFSGLMAARTRKGSLAKEYILGLKTYITVAEKERIKFHNAPHKNPGHFESLLPYAVALGVEKEWAQQFEGIYTKPPSWYSDSDIKTFNAVTFTQSFDRFSSSFSAMSTASSGSSGLGGGHSGGGGGGGGGGGW